MSRRSQLKPRRVCLRGRLRWIVSVGKDFSETGKRYRKFFPTLSTAQKFTDEIIQEKVHFRNAGIELTSAERIEYRGCLELLKKNLPSYTLEQAIHEFISTKQVIASKTIDQAIAEYQAERKIQPNLSKASRIQEDSRLRKILHRFQGQPLATISKPAIQTWLYETHATAKTQRHYASTLKLLFAFCIEQDYCKVNPADFKLKVRASKDIPAILTVAEVDLLLKKASLDAPEMLPAICLSLFAGLRRSEVFAIAWEQINLGKGFIEVNAEVAKTDHGRIIQMQPNLVAWLSLSQPQRGRVLACFNSIDSYGDRLAKLVAEIGIAEWPHNALRHSFASYRMGALQDLGKVAAEMGNTPSVSKRNYIRPVTPSDSVAYWSLKP